MRTALVGSDPRHAAGRMQLAEELLRATPRREAAGIGRGSGRGGSPAPPPALEEHQSERVGAARGHGIAAGIVAGMLYPFLAGVFFPNTNPDRPIPEGLENRIFWAMLASVIFSVALGHTLNRKTVPTETPVVK